MADLVHANERTGTRKGLAVNEHRVEYLGFVAAGDTYGVRLEGVREILKLPPVTEVPRAGPEVMGVVSVRGLLVSVLDLRRRLRGVAGEIGRKGRILLVEGPEKEMIGLYVDEVLQVFRLADSEIETAGTVPGLQTSDYVVGIGRSEGTMLVLVDLGQLLGRAGVAGEGHAT
jgi:purine-binding chemotaxis protein CheW